MFTTIDKAIQDFIISLIALLAVFGFDFSNFEGVILAIAGALGKAFVTWLLPNKGN